MPAPKNDRTRYLQGGLDANEPNVVREILRAIKDADGSIEITAEALGVHRATFYRWLGRYPELRAAIDAYGDREERIVRGQEFRAVVGPRPEPEAPGKAPRRGRARKAG